MMSLHNPDEMRCDAKQQYLHDFHGGGDADDADDVAQGRRSPLILWLSSALWLCQVIPY